MAVDLFLCGLIVASVKAVSRQIPLAHRRVLVPTAALVVVSVCGAHIANRPRLTYPLDRWAMYGSDSPPRFYTAESIVLAGGRMMPYPFRIAAFAEPRAIKMRLEQTIESCACDTHDGTADQFISGLVDYYEAESGEEVEQFDVDVVSIAGGSLGQKLRLYAWRPARGHR